MVYVSISDIIDSNSILKYAQPIGPIYVTFEYINNIFYRLCSMHGAIYISPAVPCI